MLSTHELDWILPRADKVDAGQRSALRPDVDSIVLGAAVSVLLILLSGALWVVRAASIDDGDTSSQAATVVTAR